MIFDDLRLQFNDIEFLNDKIYVTSKLTEVLMTLKTNKLYDFDILTTIVAVDLVNFVELNYILYSTSKNEFLTIAFKSTKTAPTVINVFKSAYFDECEIYDLFGIEFLENKNLKRLLMPDSWIGHPLLKSYKQEDARLAWNE